MRILVVGAGVIGSVNAAKLAQAGHHVVLLGRGCRLSDLKAHGLVLEEAQSGQRTAVSVLRATREAFRAAKVRCPLLVVVCDDDQSALAAPAIKAAKRATGAELISLRGGHYAPFLDGHEQVVEAELSFLRRHLLHRSDENEQRSFGRPSADPVEKPTHAPN